MEAKQNAPVLLQTCQLWAVLSALSTSQVTEGGERSLADWEVKLPELHIIEGLSFSLIDLQGKGEKQQTQEWDWTNQTMINDNRRLVDLYASARYLQLPVLDRWRSSKILDSPTFSYRAIDLHLWLRLDGASKAWIRQRGQEVNHTSSKIQRSDLQNHMLYPGS